MGKRDPRVNAYIARSAPFARPILRHIRKVVHAACPAVEETIKWSFPHFMHEGMLCSMAAFKNHCALGFWKQPLLAGHIKAAAKAGGSAMGQFGRLCAVADLPDANTLARLVREAAALKEQGAERSVRAKPKKHRRLTVPAYFVTALRRNKKAMATFEGFSYTNRKDYVEWVTEARQEKTRRRRLSTAIAGMTEGKPRNWKYIRS